MNRFIARENIKRFRERLRTETDKVVQSCLQKLLVLEEDKLGADLEVLIEIERHISDGRHRIERQRVIVADMERDGHNGLAQARCLLEGFEEAQLIHENYRKRIKAEYLLSRNTELKA